MSRIFIDGFESGEHDMWDINAGAIVMSPVGLPMDGDYCLDLVGNTDHLDKNIAVTNEMYFAFLYRPSAEDSVSMISLWDGTVWKIRLNRASSSNVIIFYRGGTQLDAGTIALTVGGTYLIEFWCLIHGISGRMVVKVDGITDIDYTGDTEHLTGDKFNKVMLGYDTGVSSYPGAYFDNFIMDDSSWIGDTKIQALVPTGVGNSSDWTPSVGNNYACVDEIPPNDADYVSVNAVNATDTYITENLSGSIDSIKCIQVQSRSRKEGIPIPTNLKLITRVNGTNYLSGDKPVPSSMESRYNLWELNPDDSQAWEEVDINAMEIGIRSTV